ncbi:MAG TPA: hypothetical protein QGF58_30070 [Myxococcota bacterium]|nr:hypothetical protein [Myxococcota bacterium]
MLAEAPSGPETRVVITTKKLRYDRAGEDMPVFLTLYNPGPAREVDLVVLFQVEDLPPVPWGVELDFPDAEVDGHRTRLSLPEDSVWFDVPPETAHPEASASAPSPAPASSSRRSSDPPAVAGLQHL